MLKTWMPTACREEKRGEVKGALLNSIFKITEIRIEPIFFFFDAFKRFPVNILSTFKEHMEEIISQTIKGIKQFRNFEAPTIKYFRISAREWCILEVLCSVTLISLLDPWRNFFFLEII